MKSIATIRGKPIKAVYESFDGSYWYVIEEAWKQDSLIDGKIYEKDQVFFGYVRLSYCPELAEFGYFSETELRRLGNWTWRVPQRNWSGCPDVEMQDLPDNEVGLASGRAIQPDPSIHAQNICKEVD